MDFRDSAVLVQTFVPEVVGVSSASTNVDRVSGDEAGTGLRCECFEYKKCKWHLRSSHSQSLRKTATI